MSGNKVRIGVIGAGQIGKHHLQNYATIEDAEIVAIADINEAEAQRVAAQHNIPHIYTDFRKLLERDDIVAVDVALHNNLHSLVTVEALRAGKHVYCEKPMAGAYCDAKIMLDTAREQGLMLHIQLISLYSAETRAAKTLVDAGKLGSIYHARSNGLRRRGRPFVDGYGSMFFVKKEHAASGALYDMGVYHIAQVLYLIGNPGLVSATGKLYQEIEMDKKRRAESSFDVEEVGMGFVRLEGNITLDIIEAWAMHMDKMDSSAIFGNEGGLRLQPLTFFHNLDDLEMTTTFDLDRFLYRLRMLRENSDAYEGPQPNWIAALQGRAALLPTAEIALNTMLISEGIMLSDRLQREVTAEEVEAESVSTAIAV
jgi:predicted dehydrogenase